MFKLLEQHKEDVDCHHINVCVFNSVFCRSTMKRSL